MIANLGIAIRTTIVTVVILGFLYPLFMTAAAQAIFPFQARGSLLTGAGHPIGSLIIGERWTSSAYFQGRPSAAGKHGYDPTSTGGTNYGATSKKLIEGYRSVLKDLRSANPGQPVVPPELVEASGSGIDPDISPQAAYYQVARVAAARRADPSAIRALVTAHVAPRTLGILGEPRVNVLDLNLALDAHFSRPNAR